MATSRRPFSFSIRGSTGFGRNRGSFQNQRNFNNNDNIFHQLKNPESNRKRSLNSLVSRPFVKKFKANNDENTLTNEILNHFDTIKQVQSTYYAKWNLCQDLFSMLSGIVPDVGVFLVGSSASGFAAENTDADICIVISQIVIDQKREAVKFLEILRKSCRRYLFVGGCDLIRARVPILRFTDSASRLRCDLNINNVTGIRNTDLLRFYSETDPRVAPLVLSLKTWAKFHNINDASQQTLSSYSLTLMIIYYLQSIASPPVVPVWQQLLPDRFDAKIPCSQLKRNDKPSELWQSQNIQLVGELFIGFLSYYVKQFRFEDYAISVRLGSLLDKEDFLDNDRTNYGNSLIAIEEPFDLTNTARSVFDENEFQRIVRVFRRSYYVILKSKTFESIIHEQYN